MDLPHPTIIVDREYGQYVDDIDINVASLRPYLQSRDLSSEQINATVVHLSSESVDHYDGRLTGSCYKNSPELVSLYYVEDLQHAVGNLAVTASVRYIEQQLERNIARTLAHEFEHRVIYTQPRSDEKVAFLKQIAVKLEEIGDGDTDELGKWVYFNDPDEARCLASEKYAPTDLVRVRLKQPV